MPKHQADFILQLVPPHQLLFCLRCFWKEAWRDMGPTLNLAVYTDLA